jgi:hypothetical protein
MTKGRVSSPNQRTVGPFVEETQPMPLLAPFLPSKTTVNPSDSSAVLVGSQYVLPIEKQAPIGSNEISDEDGRVSVRPS